MTGEPENERCYFCGGRLAPGLATLPFVMGSSVVIIKGVPAEICNQCGEAITSSEVAAAIDAFLKQVQRSGFEISVVAYESSVLTAT
ncbi:MAG: type II toxin-antitoxin system MqsA family antitoxin [Anaerolineae bacterium]